MQYTLRSVPKKVDAALRERAKHLGKSLNTVLIETLEQALGVDQNEMNVRDLSDISGSWVRDKTVERILQEQRTIDEEMWK